MKITIFKYSTITEIHPEIEDSIKSALTVPNPAYVSAEKGGRWTGNIDPYAYFYSYTTDGIVVPRGFTGLAIWLAKQYDKRLQFKVNDCTITVKPVDFEFSGTLKPFQQRAVEDILKKDMGVLEAPTGSGKTIMALNIIAQRKQPCLIIVHNTELLNQWKERISTFMGIDKKDIGTIGTGKYIIKPITVGIVNSVQKVAGQIFRLFGHVVVDECHRCPSATFIDAVSYFPAKYVLGLSATMYRRDGLTKIISWYLGNNKVKIEQGDLTESDIIKNVEVNVRHTGITPYTDGATEYSRMLSELTESDERNKLIARDVINESNGDGILLVLTDRKEHCERMRQLISESVPNTEVLTGDMSSKKRTDVVERLNNGEIKVIIATGQLIGEGFDCKGLSKLFLITPIKFTGRLTQYLGRVLRVAENKRTAIIFDYVDDTPVLEASFRSREKIYNQWI